MAILTQVEGEHAALEVEADVVEVFLHAIKGTTNEFRTGLLGVGEANVGIAGHRIVLRPVNRDIVPAAIAAMDGDVVDHRGRLVTERMDADFVVLDQDPHDVAAESVEALADIKVLNTFRLGRMVYDRDTYKPSRKKTLPGALLSIAAGKVSKLLKR